MEEELMLSHKLEQQTLEAAEAAEAARPHQQE
jgi:hypothetical protein